MAAGTLRIGTSTTFLIWQVLEITVGFLSRRG